MSASAPVVGSSSFVLERSIMFLRLLVGCWVVIVAVGAAWGIAVGIAGGLYS